MLNLDNCLKGPVCNLIQSLVRTTVVFLIHMLDSFVIVATQVDISSLGCVLRSSSYVGALCVCVAFVCGIRQHKCDTDFSSRVIAVYSAAVIQYETDCAGAETPPHAPPSSGVTRAKSRTLGLNGIGRNRNTT
jgi:hypothetical protein